MMTEEELKRIAFTAPKKFYWIKDFQRWGLCPTVRDDRGRVRFHDKGQWLTPVKMLAVLRAEWRPVAQDDYDYFASGQLERELTRLQQLEDCRAGRYAAQRKQGGNL
jgi:hypothetical protein